MSGLLVNGSLRAVPGVSVLGPHEAPWAFLSAGDCTPRSHWPTQWVLHKTLADDPEHVLPGSGPSAGTGGAEATAEYWAGDPEHSGAHGVTGHDGTAVCLADLVLVEAWHARAMNPRSVGWETKEVLGGGVYQAALETTVAITLVGVEALGIQLQVPRAYNGRPLRRFANGGADLVGVFGHRDGDDARGHWDPGDRLFTMLLDHGAEAFDFEAGEDLSVWKGRQQMLVNKGHRLVIDGIPGPATTAALKLEGYRGGVWALGRS